MSVLAVSYSFFFLLLFKSCYYHSSAKLPLSQMSKEKGVPSESSNQKLETTTLANQNLNETAPPPDYYRKNDYYKKDKS